MANFTFWLVVCLIICVIDVQMRNEDPTISKYSVLYFISAFTIIFSVLVYADEVDWLPAIF